MKGTRVFFGGLALALVLNTLACAKGRLIQERARTAAPAGPHDVGLLLDGAKSEEVEKLLRLFPEAQVRVLNSDHGLYEVFGVPRDQASLQTQALITENTYFQMKPPERPMRPNESPVGTIIEGLLPCLGGPPPQAKLTTVKPATGLHGASITLGQAVQVSNSSDTSEVVRSSLLVFVPDSSLMKSYVIKNPEQHEFIPDAMGTYRLVLAVQNQKNVCALTVIRFVVTANRPYNGPFTADAKFDLKKMKHLNQVSASQAWSLSEGEGLLMAVIDTGVNYNHPALADSIAINEAEIPNNDLDDDGNGFVDDVIGYDFVNGDVFPYDDSGHGSHVAGLAVGRPFGIARKAKMIPIKAMTGLGGDMGSVAGAIRYAVDRGVRIINLSLGESAPTPHPALVSAINYADRKGVLIVAASGNGDPATGLGMDLDKVPNYPAALNNSNILTVGAFDSENALSIYSNFGAKTVDVIAPGGLPNKEPILSATFETPRNNLLEPMVGTSMATPIVAGIAAQVWSRSPHLPIERLKEILLSAGKQFEDLKPVCASGRHIDAIQALQLGMDAGNTPSNVLF